MTHLMTAFMLWTDPLIMLLKEKKNEDYSMYMLTGGKWIPLKSALQRKINPLFWSFAVKPEKLLWAPGVIQLNPPIKHTW